ncbi:hypothetical protein [Marisediminicola senii]|uniref:hypothetical protein n=1 Tax=Marisediminicola senii TaxID=2711233 RepID=UPI0013EC773C|nr:hypothetical protein [Marisediminicola senii]
MTRKKRRENAAQSSEPDQTPPSMNPYDGKTGFFNNLNRITYKYAGPAQVGIGRPEAPYAPQVDPRCPLCNQRMDLHRIDSTPARTHYRCPDPAAS